MTTTTQRIPRLPLAIGLIISLVSWLFCRPWDTKGWLVGAPFGHDFINFWMAPRLLVAGRGNILVDLPAYASEVRATFHLSHDPGFVFVYPPHAALLLIPFACLPFVIAIVAWTIANILSLWFVARLCGMRGWIIAAVCLSPPAAAMVIYGHFGGFLAIAATVAVVESRRRPWCAGLCLALLSVKPQFALALGLILICAGRWRWLPAAALGTAVLVCVSAAVFGVEAWRQFVAVTMPMQSAFVTEFRAGAIHPSVSPYFSLRLLDMPVGLVWAIQGSVSILALLTGVLVLRRAADGLAQLLIVLLAALVAQPYVAHYDLAIAAPAFTFIALSTASSPLLLAAWLLVPLVRIFYFLDLPVLGLIVPGALFAQAARLLGPQRVPASQLRSAIAAASGCLIPHSRELQER